MYHHHFGFHGKPFQSALPERAFFPSASLRQIIPVALHTLRSDLGVAVLTGPAGIGKSALLKHLQRGLQTDGQSVVFSAGAVRTPAAMLGLLQRRLRAAQSNGGEVPELSVKSGTAEHWQVVDRLAQTVDFWGPLIVLMDDAHVAGPEIFSELRALLEEEVDGRRLVRVLVSGALSLEDVLAAPAMTDFVQKIRSHVFIEPLRSNEAVGYITTHLRAVGGDIAGVFQPVAIEHIVAAADGVPRYLNLLADESLLVASEMCVAQVTAAHVDAALRRLQHLPYAWNVSLTDSADEESPADPSETVEVSASPGSTFSGDGVIEIGAPVPGEANNEQRAVSSIVPQAAPRIPAAASGVIEIGAIEEPEAAEQFEEVPEPPAFDNVNAADHDAIVHCNIDHDLDDHDLIDEVEEDAVAEADADPAVEISQETACEGADEELPRPAFQDFELWMPAGSWPVPAAPATRSHEASVAELPNSGWVRQPRGVTPMPVFDRYTWQEYGREVPFGDTVGRRYVDVPSQAAVWPPDLTGVAPATDIPIDDLADSFAVISLQRQALDVEEAIDLPGCELDDDDLLPAPEQFGDFAGADSPDDSDGELKSVLPPEASCDDKCEARKPGRSDEVTAELMSAIVEPADEPLSVAESTDDLAPWTGLLAGASELQPSASESNDDELLPALSDLHPLEFDDNEPAAQAADSAEVTSKEPAWVSLFETAQQPAAWHDGQLLETKPADTTVSAEEAASDDIVSLPISDSEQPTRVAADAMMNLPPEQASRVDRLFTLPVPINDVNLSRRDGAYSDLEHSAVTDALLRLDNAADPFATASEGGKSRGRKPDDIFAADSHVHRSDAAFQSDDESEQAVLPDGRLSTDGKLRFETLFTRLRQRKPGSR